MSSEIKNPEISFPRDLYAHANAPTEWWWHAGTLESADGDKFGFEIHMTRISSTNQGYIYIAITDVAKQIHYHRVSHVEGLSSDWAESDPSKPWFVKLGSLYEHQATISVKAIDDDPQDMHAIAVFSDANSAQGCKLDLTFCQEPIQPGSIDRRKPLYVGGTGWKKVEQDNDDNDPLKTYNFFYSLTWLKTSGTLKIGTEKIDVTGLTWMDHQYGYFPLGSTPGIWMLLDMQLSNGYHLSNFTNFGARPEEGVPMNSNTTVLEPNGKSVFYDSVITPLGPVYISDKGIGYYTNFKVYINSPGKLRAEFSVSTLMPAQVFVDSKEPDAYEGVARCEGIFNGVFVSGSTWIEQNLG